METRVKELCVAMSKVNLLSNYTYTKDQIIEYAEQLINLYPNIKVEKIESLMDSFFRCKKDFTPSRGIRNFTEHLEQPQEKTGYVWKYDWDSFLKTLEDE